MTLAHALTPLPHTRACVPSPTSFVVELPLPRLRFPQSNISDRGVVLGDIPSAFCDPIVRGGESPYPSFLWPLFSAPKGGGGGGAQPWGQHSPDRMLGKYLVSAGGRCGGRLGLAHTGFPVLLQPFFFSLLSSFFWQWGPPPRRVTQASAICLLPGWGWQVLGLPGWAGPRPQNLLSGFPSSCPEALAPSPACCVLPLPAG